MKMIEVLNMMAEGEIKEGTKIILNDDLFIFNGGVFGSGLYHLENCMFLKKEDLNQEVELILPKEKKYLIKLTIKGINDGQTYLNRNREKNVIFLSDNFEGQCTQTKFTKQELQSIQPVREFLEDMQGKYTLIEVEENEND